MYNRNRYFIGHEITHAFDDQGRQFDFDGNMVDWWDRETEKQFLEKAQCIIEQYGSYKDPRSGLSVIQISMNVEYFLYHLLVLLFFSRSAEWCECPRREHCR